ncbi:hypothetical protein HYQ44_020001 [Verticillium longisporum]|nr:hypothetical protein HYQ44_020001 [Verticillium longisporum]
MLKFRWYNDPVFAAFAIWALMSSTRQELPVGQDEIMNAEALQKPIFENRPPPALQDVQVVETLSRKKTARVLELICSGSSAERRNAEHTICCEDRYPVLTEAWILLLPCAWPASRTTLCFGVRREAEGRIECWPLSDRIGQGVMGQASVLWRMGEVEWTVKRRGKLQMTAQAQRGEPGGEFAGWSSERATYRGMDGQGRVWTDTACMRPV